ncbi:hypothetical protein B0H17DRAFT_1123484 [Mycena rosella]|uniref:Chromo domain-containing protein n=1 Tax=Mycena rosella TaxID=1033263 RepID=A0AAD7H1Q8_MYCRO|nr:hypothetical protein B0H17DRAFT_1123484 [Mycena rosella]
MTSPDWSQTQERLLQNKEFAPDVIFRPSAVRDTDKFAADVSHRTLFGHPKDVKPIKPNMDDFKFLEEELSRAPPPSETVLIPPTSGPDDPQPEKNFLFPRASIYTLKKTSAYQRGYVYTTPYFPENKDTEHARLLRTVAPPQLYPEVVEGKYVHRTVPECIQMVPGVPFAYEIDGKPDQLHTIGAVHTFPSLRHETDFWDILKDTIIVAKGLRGCRPVGNMDEVFPITDFPLKPNDRSPVNVAGDSKAGSYNLASTLLKGVGPGVVLPAAQVDTPKFRGQVCTVLKSLSDLRRCLLAKTLSKFELETTEFNSQDMNVVGFGGLDPSNATSCQLNNSSIWQLLAKALGWQGRMHTDPRDAPTRKTYFLALLSLPRGSDAGAFLLGRHGIYIRELDTWAIHIFFDGVDIHTGIGATTTLSVPEFQKWVESDLETAWKLSEYSRIGVVQYASQAAHSRDAYMSMTPSVRFGNFGPEQHHLAIQRDFATHGQEILGGQEPWANRMGREIVQGFWNQLQHCNLDLGIDINHLLQSITFKNDSGADINLKPLPRHPVKDADSIARQRGHYEFFRQQCERMHIYIEKSHYHAYQKRLREETYDPAEDNDSWTVTWKSRSSFPTKSGNRADVPPSDISGSIVKILEHVRVASQGCYRILTDEPDASPQLIKENDPRLQRQMVTEFLANQLKKISSVPLILVPLVQGVQSGDGMPGIEFTSATGITSGAADTQPDESIQLSTSTSSSSDGTSVNTVQPDTTSISSTSASSNSPSGPVDQSPVAHTGSENSAHGEITNSPGRATRSKTAAQKEAPNSCLDDDDDRKWDITEIVALDRNKQGNWYQCKFAGYKEPEWVHENNLSEGCEELLKEFYQSLADQESESESDDPSDSEERPPPKRARLGKGKKPLRKPAKPAGISLGNTQHLEVLLNPDRLGVEVAEVKEARPTVGRASKMFFQAIESPSFVPTILETCLSQHSLLSTFQIVVDADWTSPQQVAIAQFNSLATSTSVMSKLTAYERVTGLLTRILQLTNSCALITIYRWCSSVGPQTAKALFELHRDKGHRAFTANPSLGLLVDHIVQFVCDAKTRAVEKERVRRAARNKNSQTPTPKAVSIKHGAFGAVVQDLLHLPGDLYGLIHRNGAKKLSSITLVDPSGGSALDVYSSCQTCLMEAFHKALVMPALRDSNDVNNRSRTDDDNSIYARAICRGAVLDCILEACQDDGVLSSNVLADALHSPWLSFPIDRVDRLSTALLHRTEITLEPLRLWLADYIEKKPAVVHQIKSLGDEIHAVLQEMVAGEPHQDSVSASAVLLPKKAAPRPSKPRAQKAKVALPYLRPHIESILPGGRIPNLALPAFIIREALNLQRRLAAGDAHLRRLILGHHATQNSSIQRNPDHFDPRRQYNRYTSLFRQHISGTMLTKAAGLSNALSWFGTVQGYVTESFLDHLTGSGGFFTSDCEGMVRNFRTIILRNSSLADTIRYDNSKAWGQQPNPALLAEPTKNVRQSTAVVAGTKRAHGGKKKKQNSGEPKEKYTLEEKFGPLFEQSVQDKWTAHLGPLANKEPSTYEGKLPTWSSTIALLKSLEISSFKTGLTAMQLVNTLSISNVIQMPSVMEMAEWIADNPKLGAVKGLELLGFQTNTRDRIIASYICFHNYLDVHLVQGDKEILGFHPPFSEHVLCKTPRWDKYLKEDKSVTLVNGLNSSEAWSVLETALQQDKRDKLIRMDIEDEDDVQQGVTGSTRAQAVGGANSTMVIRSLEVFRDLRWGEQESGMFRTYAVSLKVSSASSATVYHREYNVQGDAELSRFAHGGAAVGRVRQRTNRGESWVNLEPVYLAWSCPILGWREDCFSGDAGMGQGQERCVALHFKVATTLVHEAVHVIHIILVDVDRDIAGSDIILGRLYVRRTLPSERWTASRRYDRRGKHKDLDKGNEKRSDWKGGIASNSLSGTTGFVDAERCPAWQQRHGKLISPCSHRLTRYSGGIGCHRVLAVYQKQEMRAVVLLTIDQAHKFMKSGEIVLECEVKRVRWLVGSVGLRAPQPAPNRCQIQPVCCGVLSGALGFLALIECTAPHPRKS